MFLGTLDKNISQKECIQYVEDLIKNLKQSINEIEEENESLLSEIYNYESNRTYLSPRDKKMENEFPYMIVQRMKKSIDIYDNNLKRIHDLELRLKTTTRFKKLVKRYNLFISKSPYSSSLYAFKEGEFIDWNYKPEGSFRLSDHWNFYDSNGVLHCATDKKITDGIFNICRYNDGVYSKISS